MWGKHQRNSNTKTQKSEWFDSKLGQLHAVGKVDLQGLSLVTKFSHDLPEMILTCDESGYVYLINSMELELKKEKDILRPINLVPKSSNIVNSINFILFIIQNNINVIMEPFLMSNGMMTQKSF
jgi:hypothetical protein